MPIERFEAERVRNNTATTSSFVRVIRDPSKSVRRLAVAGVKRAQLVRTNKLQGSGGRATNRLVLVRYGSQTRAKVIECSRTSTQ